MSRIRRILQKSEQRRIRKAISNTRKYKAQIEAEKVRQKHLKAEIDAKNKLEKLRAETQKLKEKRGSSDLKKGIKNLGKAVKILDKKFFGD